MSAANEILAPSESDQFEKKVMKLRYLINIHVRSQHRRLAVS